MKACKGLFLFCFLGITISSCFDPPVFTDTPQISVNKITFKQVEGSNTGDTLFLYLDFKDGDGDLGLDGESEASSQYPYHEQDYFLADGIVIDGKGNLNSVRTIPQLVPEPNSTTGGEMIVDLVITDGANGKLVTNRTRTQPNYGYLPIFDPDANDCTAYTRGLYLMVAEDDNLVDASYNIIDTLLNTQNNKRYFIVDEPFYKQRNPNHFNIDVEFWKFDPVSATYKEYDWLKEFCTEFNGRFPLIPHKIGTPIEGTIKYAMVNDAFLTIFTVQKLKLKIRIRDRALNVSNEVETPSFDLQGICTNCSQ